MTRYLNLSGFTGAEEGFVTVFGNVVSEEFNVEAFIIDLGKKYEITRNYFKGHACCRYNHATLDAISEIIKKSPDKMIASDKVERIEVDTYNLAAQLNYKSLWNTLAAKFSIPFAAVTFIVNHSADIESFNEKAIHDPVIREQASRVSISEKADLTAMLPERRASRVRITLTDGSVFEA